MLWTLKVPVVFIHAPTFGFIINHHIWQYNHNERGANQLDHYFQWQKVDTFPCIFNCTILTSVAQWFKPPNCPWYISMLYKSSLGGPLLYFKWDLLCSFATPPFLGLFRVACVISMFKIILIYLTLRSWCRLSVQPLIQTSRFGQKNGKSPCVSLLSAFFVLKSLK